MKLAGDSSDWELRRYVDQLLGANMASTLTKYYVVDSSSSQFGDLIRREILRRDVTHVVEFIRDKDVREFAIAFPSVNPYRLAWVEERISVLRERMQTEDGTTQGDDSLISLLVDSIRSLERERDDVVADFEASLFADWWIANAEYLGSTIPDISSRYFSEIAPDNSTLEQLDELLDSKELNGYFILPEGFPDSNSTIEYMTGELLDSHDRRSAFLLKQWYEEIVSAVLSNLRTATVGTDEGNNLLPSIATAINVPIQFDDDSSSTRVSFDSDEELRYLTLWVRSIWTGLFWIATFYSVYAMSFNTTEEKQSRIAEVLLASVSHKNLMDGKVMGNVLVILTVCGSWMVILGLPITCIIALAPDLESNALRVLFSPMYILNWFVFLLLVLTMLGYLLTALGALFSTDRVMNTTYLVLVALFSIGLLTSLDPESTLASWVKFVPPVTPFAMVSHTTTLPSWPIYLLLLALVMTFLWAIRYYLVLVFTKGIFLDAVPGKFGRLIKTLSTPH